MVTVCAKRWLERIREQARSGLPQRAYCDRHGLNTGTFAWWKRRLGMTTRRRGRRARASGRPPEPRPGWPETAEPEFVEVRLADAATASGYEIVLPQGRTIRVLGRFDAQELSRLIAAVECVDRLVREGSVSC